MGGCSTIGNIGCVLDWSVVPLVPLLVFTLLLIEELSTLDFGLDLLGRMVNILKVEASLFVLVQYGALLNPEEKQEWRRHGRDPKCTMQSTYASREAFWSKRCVSS